MTLKKHSDSLKPNKSKKKPPSLRIICYLSQTGGKGTYRTYCVYLMCSAQRFSSFIIVTFKQTSGSNNEFACSLPFIFMDT